MTDLIRITNGNSEHWAMYPTSRIVKFFNKVVRRDRDNTLLRLLRIAARKNQLKSLICILDQDVFESDIVLEEFDEFWKSSVKVGNNHPESFNDTVRLIIEESKSKTQ